jgi:1,4-alpha-glucan branching enzyme
MIKTTKKTKTTSAKTAIANPIAETSAPVSAAPAKPSTPKPNQVSLELVKPGAKRVCVAGSFNGWIPEKSPLVPAGNDRWVGDLAVKPGRHEYLFVVDGQWLPDPNAKETVQNPFGGKNSVLLVSA